MAKTNMIPKIRFIFWHAIFVNVKWNELSRVINSKKKVIRQTLSSGIEIDWIWLFTYLLFGPIDLDGWGFARARADTLWLRSWRILRVDQGVKLKVQIVIRIIWGVWCQRKLFLLPQQRHHRVMFETGSDSHFVDLLLLQLWGLLKQVRIAWVLQMHNFFIDF